MRYDPTKYPQILRDLIDQGAERLVETCGLDPESARQAAYEMAEVLRKNWGGLCGVYLPKGFLHDLTARDREIYAKFDGTNHAQLAREYKLTERQIYTIIARVGEEVYRRDQRPLDFGT